MVPKPFLLLAMACLLPVAAGCDLRAGESAAAASTRDVIGGRTLSVTELKALIDRNAPVHIYDANVRDDYVEGHVQGARWVEYDAIDAADLPPSKDAMLVFYCYNPQCGASHVAAEQARALGYRNVWRMPEGIVGWRAARLPVIVGPAPD